SGMGRTIQVRESEPQAAVVVRATTTPEKIGQDYGDLIQEVSAYLREKGVDPSGPSFNRYLQYGEDRVEMEVGLPIAVVGEPVPEPDPRMAYVELPGGEAAITWHLGGYEGLSEMWDALHGWLTD